LAKVTKTARSRNASLPHKAFAHKADKTTGCNLFAGLPWCFNTLHAKICYASCHYTGHPFCPLFSEAYLLRFKKTKARSGTNLIPNLNQKRVKA